MTFPASGFNARNQTNSARTVGGMRDAASFRNRSVSTTVIGGVPSASRMVTVYANCG